MSLHSPSIVIGYHSSDKDVALKGLYGQDELIASQNSWDWLGEGIYFHNLK